MRRAALPFAALLALACAAPAAVPAQVALTAIASGQPEPILSDGWQEMGAGNAPVAFHACFHTPHSLALLTETFTVYDAAHPFAAPADFACYDAARIGADLATGTAVAFLSQADIAPGLDRVVAVYADGRAYLWQQPKALAGN